MGSLPKKEDEFNGLAEFYPFKPDVIKCLQEYQKDLDFDRACRSVGINYKAKKKLLDVTTDIGSAFVREMEAIQREYQVAIRLNANSSAKKHLELMEKFENDYDVADMKSPTKSGLASTLAKMSDSSLKASGKFSSTEDNSGVKVEINIDLTTNADKQEPIEVKAETVTDVD